MKSETRKYVVYPPLGMLLLSSFLGGCGYIKTARDDVPMYRARVAAQQQTLNPEASKNMRVVAGMDAAAAKNVSEGYAKSFVKKDATQGAPSFLGLSGLENQ